MLPTKKKKREKVKRSLLFAPHTVFKAHSFPSRPQTKNTLKKVGLHKISPIKYINHQKKTNIVLNSKGQKRTKKKALQMK